MNLKRVRYKQRDFSLDDIDELKQINWNLEKYGCGPTSIANVLVNLGFKINPIDTAKKILYDRNGNFDNTYLRNKGINSNGIIYCLERLIKENKINISYNNTIKVMINKKINTNTYEEKTTTERWKDFIKQNNINTDLVVINVEYRDLNTNSSRYYNVNRNKWSGSYNEAS